MASLFRFSAHSGKERSLLALYILHTLREQPKSGYDLIKEIAEKTSGAWAPSKGTIYPLLRQLSGEELIVAVESGKRARVLFTVTEKGQATLDTIREMGRAHHRKMTRYRNLILAVFGGSEHSVKGLLFDIRGIIMEIPPGTEKEVIAVLENCRDNLHRIMQS
ncbi:MAG: PadR family transcriptional regulator [Methanoregula sp.]